MIQQQQQEDLQEDITRSRASAKEALTKQKAVMVSSDHKRATALHEKLQLLRSVTNSQAVTKTSIIVDASNYIRELKRKVDRLNQDIAYARALSEENPLPLVTVEALERGFLITVFSGKSSQGLLVSILEAFEDLGLVVREARVSCTDTLRLEVDVAGENQEQLESLNVHVIKQTVLEAIRNSRKNNDI